MKYEKICLVCKRAVISYWESTCETCWDTLTTKQKKYMVMLNTFREFLRECGIDFEDLGAMW